MNEEYQTLEANPGDELNDAASSEGTQNDDAVLTATPTDQALTLEEINQLTGHRYQTIDDARKGIDNLKRLVGKKEVVKEIADPSLVETVKTLQKQVTEATFYTEHPELKPVKDFLSKFDNPAEAIKDPVIKKAVEALQAREDQNNSEKLRSNSRIASTSSDYQKDLEEAQASGNWGPFLAKHKGIDPTK